jgi:hemoglobin-like flavoprotein
MQAQQIQLVRASFAAVQITVSQPGALFYDNLFAADPSLRNLFHSGIAQQGERLMSMIGSALELLDRPAILLPVLGQLGARHGGYGVKESHYATVGTALIRTLEQGLGVAFTDEVRQAWIDLYGVISSTMIDAAQRGSAQQVGELAEQV